MSDWEFYSETDAARGYAGALDDLKRIDKQKSGYDYSYPESLLTDERKAVEQLRKALRYLVAEDDTA